MPVAESPTLESVLQVVRTKARLVDLGRIFVTDVPTQSLGEGRSALAHSGRVGFRELVDVLSRDELRAACKAHGLDDTGRSRTLLIQRLLTARGDAVPEVAPAFGAGDSRARDLPKRGDVVRVRHRQFLVEEVHATADHRHDTRVELVCLDDDDQGRRVQVIWELELGAEILQPEAHGLGAIEHLDEPRFFAAYLHALKWNSVTATDARLFQSPFRAGIRLFEHQLTPLKKALELPRANLFIADDVGLGKTIEAGLVLQELILRQQVDFALIVCPAAVSLQWRDEMQKRFGLQFEVYTRRFVARRRQERGFGVNPWSTHNRFIVSYQTLRRPEYRDPLLQHVGERVRKSILILDEAHTIAPASSSKYAVDSQTTIFARDLAPRFENRLFLSATPHNGHSNSFSALLEILDPQRFTRGVPITAGGRDPRKRLEPVMVRRLKSDLRELGVEGYPERQVIQVSLEHGEGAWRASFGDERRDLGAGDPAELELSEKLAAYTKLVRPASGRGRLVFINLQKRLLSSAEAFYRTLRVHAQSADKRFEALDAASAQGVLFGEAQDIDEHGLDDEALDSVEDQANAASTQEVATPAGRARELLDDLLSQAEQRRAAPCAKLLALVDWIRREQCPAVQIGGADASTDRKWSDRRVIVFTEYGDTKRYLTRLLRAAIEGTERDEERILHFHGGMSDEQREQVQAAFLAPPADHPVRILIATDAAREGVNLQSHCSDLFHFDIPWNPGRMEQRNGRIDRTLQTSPVVRCHYFVYPQRREDRVLRTVVRKVEQIRSELGSLGDVVMNRVEAVLADGIGDESEQAVEGADALGARQRTTREELEAQRELKRLRADRDEAGRIYESSRKVASFAPELLEDALNVGFELAGAGRLASAPQQPAGLTGGAFVLPELPEGWQETLDSLRPLRARDEPFWEWRKRSPLPVTFSPPSVLTSEVVQLHLSHPLVQRVLSRFLAQGTSAHDLSRVTVLLTPEGTARVLAFGRLSLFGPGATRLHDQLVAVAAPWFESGGKKHLQPFADERADRRALERVEEALRGSPSLERVPEAVQRRFREAAGEDFAALWEAIKEEADARAHEAEQQLLTRGRAEAEALREILADQRQAIAEAKQAKAQGEIAFDSLDKRELRQLELDREHMDLRLEAIEQELEREPPQIEALYQVALKRLEPVGLIYLWPETRA